MEIVSVVYFASNQKRIADVNEPFTALEDSTNLNLTVIQCYSFCVWIQTSFILMPTMQQGHSVDIFI